MMPGSGSAMLCAGRPTATRSSSLSYCVTWPRQGPSTASSTPAGLCGGTLVTSDCPERADGHWPPGSSSRRYRPGDPGHGSDRRRDFDLDLLAAVTERPADEVLDALDQAAAAATGDPPRGHTGPLQLLPRPDPAHAPRRAEPHRRQRLHRRVAELLEGVPRRRRRRARGELARHWIAATRPTDIFQADRVRTPGWGPRPGRPGT